jgi:hypothetical protein
MLGAAGIDHEYIAENFYVMLSQVFGRAVYFSTDTKHFRTGKKILSEG